MRELSSDALIVFVSDSHIGGDPGCDGFESPDELEALFVELAGRDGPVELILAGDFFDFLQIGEVSEGEDRAAVTISRPEYRKMFEALRRFREESGKRVVYFPGNHDAEVWWNPLIQRTLRKNGLVDEFAFSYAASLGVGEVGGERRIIYCEHGNQFDRENIVEDYTDRLDTPLGHHVVMDFTRRVAPFGEVARGLDLSEIKMVYPLVAIPRWISSRYLYNFVQRMITHLLFPILALYVVYRVAAYLLAVSEGSPLRFFQSYQDLPRLHGLLIEISGFAALIVLVFAAFALLLRRSVRRSLAAMDVGRSRTYDPAEASRKKVQEVMEGDASPPMDDTIDPKGIDVFVSGHTHLPSLEEAKRPDGGKYVMVNSGCWLRQLQPVRARLKGPPVFVSKFVLTHARVFAEGGRLNVELREHPKPAKQNLTSIERLLSWRRMPDPPRPDEAPGVRASAVL